MQCIVCYEPLVGKIFQCLLGSHNVCESCCENIRLSGKNACPIDRTPGGFIPNPRLEKEIALLTQKCVNDGCEQKVLPWTMEAHLETCEFANFQCPLCHSMVISDNESDDAEATSPSTTSSSSSSSSSSSASPTSQRAATGCFFERHLRVACVERFVPTQLVSGGMRLTQGQSSFHRQDPMHFVLFKSLPGLPSSSPPILYEFSAICLRNIQGTGRKSMKVTFSSGGSEEAEIRLQPSLQRASGVIETTAAAASNSMPNAISNDAYIPNLMESAARNPGGDAASVASSSSTPIAPSNHSSGGASSSPQRLTFTLSVSPTRPSAPRPGHIEPFSNGSGSNSSGSVASSAVTSLQFSSPVRLSMTNSAASPSAQAPIALVPSSLSAALANHAPPLPPPRSVRDRGDVCSTIVQVPCWRRAKPTTTVPAAFLALPSANTTLALIGAFNVGDLLDSLDTRNVWCEAQVRFTQRSIHANFNCWLQNSTLIFSFRLLDIHLAGGGDQGRSNLSALPLLERQVGYLGARRVGKDCAASHAHDWAQYQPQQSVRQPKR